MFALVSKAIVLDECQCCGVPGLASPTHYPPPPAALRPAAGSEPVAGSPDRCLSIYWQPT